MSENTKILIAGGSGAIGKYLEDFLMQKNFSVVILSRNKNKTDGKRVFYWDTVKNEIDSRCFENVSHVIQLSGADISKKRWTAKRKKEIIDSRVNSTNLLFEGVRKNKISLQSFISASGVGYYGSNTTTNIYTEKDIPGIDFLGQTCVEWEKAAEHFASLSIRAVMIRTGIVLMKDSGALPQLLTPAKFGVLPVLGTGKQYFPWIHIKDLCEIYYHAIINENIKGPVNAVAPVYTTNLGFSQALKKSLKKPLLLLRIPGVFLKIAFGKLSETLLKGSRISPDKIMKTGFVFEFDTAEKALSNLMK